MLTDFARRFLFRTPLHILIPCHILLSILLGSIGGIIYQTCFVKNEPVKNEISSQVGQEASQTRANAITEREIVVSNRNFRVSYEYTTNVTHYTGTNSIVIRIRRANVSVYEMVGGSTNKIDGTMNGIIIKTGNFDKQSDEFYVLKALAATNIP